MSFLGRVPSLLARISRTVQQQQCTIYSINEGTIASRPYKFNWGLVPVLLVSVPSMYVGGMAAKRGAEFLEDWNIFVVEDDDDD